MHAFLLRSSSVTKIFYLFLSAFVGFFLMQVLMLLLLRFIDLGDDNSAIYLRLSAFVQGVLMFLLPAISIAVWSDAHPATFLKIGQLPNTNRLCWISLSLIVISAPFIGLLTTLNNQIVLPESFASIETWMRTMEDSAMTAIDTLMRESSLSNVLLNLLLIAVVPAVCEEFFFRGAFQQLLQQWTRSAHAAVWTAAFVFSAIHVQFFGFVPRLILGALLGYIFLYTRNLWIPIIVHFLNNALAILNFYYISESSDFSQVEGYSTDVGSIVFALGSGALTIYMLFLMRKKAHVIN